MKQQKMSKSCRLQSLRYGTDNKFEYQGDWKEFDDYSGGSVSIVLTTTTGAEVTVFNEHNGYYKHQYVIEWDGHHDEDML